VLLMLLIGLRFAGAGLVILYVATSSLRRDPRVRKLETEHPGEPSLHEPRWHEPRLRSGAARDCIGTALATLFWNGISTPLYFVLSREIWKVNYLAVLLAMIPMRPEEKLRRLCR